MGGRPKQVATDTEEVDYQAAHREKSLCVRSCVIGPPVFPETRFRVKIPTAPILENGDRRAPFPGRSERT